MLKTGSSSFIFDFSDSSYNPYIFNTFNGQLNLSRLREYTAKNIKIQGELDNNK